MDRVQPLKKFGQNYLKDKNILLKIVEEINPKEDDVLIEIGPGLGALTRELSARISTFTAIEIDKRVCEDLKSEFSNLTLVNDDFLKIDLLPLFGEKNKKLRIVGNIPYNITSPIIFKLIENVSIVEDAVFMIQHEVAKRFTAEKGTKDYGILAVILQYFAEVKYCFKVSPNVFYPKPKVFSAVVHIYFNTERQDVIFNKLFIKVVKACFGNRRKTLKNSLNNSIFGNLDFSLSPVDLSLRAEQLDLDDFISLSRYIRNKLASESNSAENRVDQ